MKRSVALTIAIVGAGTVFVLALNTLDRVEVAPVNQATVSQDDNTDSTAGNQEANETSEILAAVLESNEQVLARLDSLDARLNHLERDRTLEEERQTEMQERRELLSRAKQNPKLVAGYMDQMKKAREQRGEIIEKRFETEPVDRGWAKTTEEQLLDSFAKNLESKASLNNVECRSSMCRVELGLANASAQPMDSANFMELELQLLGEMASAESGPIQAHHWFEDDGVGGLRYITYASRGGNGLPNSPSPFSGMTVEEAIEFLESQDP